MRTELIPECGTEWKTEWRTEWRTERRTEYKKACIERLAPVVSEKGCSFFHISFPQWKKMGAKPKLNLYFSYFLGDVFLYFFHYVQPNIIIHLCPV